MIIIQICFNSTQDSDKFLPQGKKRRKKASLPLLSIKLKNDRFCRRRAKNALSCVFSSPLGAKTFSPYAFLHAPPLSHPFRHRVIYVPAKTSYLQKKKKHKNSLSYVFFSSLGAKTFTPHTIYAPFHPTLFDTELYKSLLKYLT